MIHYEINSANQKDLDLVEFINLRGEREDTPTKLAIVVGKDLQPKRPGCLLSFGVAGGNDVRLPPDNYYTKDVASRKLVQKGRKYHDHQCFFTIGSEKKRPLLLQDETRVYYQTAFNYVVPKKEGVPTSESLHSHNIEACSAPDPPSRGEIPPHDSSKLRLTLGRRPGDEDSTGALFSITWSPEALVPKRHSEIANLLLAKIPAKSGEQKNAVEVKVKVEPGADSSTNSSSSKGTSLPVGAAKRAASIEVPPVPSSLSTTAKVPGVKVPRTAVLTRDGEY
ncbi:hypothetical protein B0T26DRAFT_874423 [Lasiosphaeria miniovina]|uniref:Uncharacterized protein n=1 Tax=Lasiosphaeria miniovina TaxID=1954250 RepID=A0AA40A4W1_9PEZI|nr:uncharacterized protein B0T26DRAFT_874423 [Lasiosphaeria miniovina]KAK0709315.1 hypothetical protein B0T26DRAFT_874423 [Lasiosphaeria miniovina]